MEKICKKTRKRVNIPHFLMKIFDMLEVVESHC